jgi:hypothetical protein
MSSSIFADESGDESAREGRTGDRRRSVFRRRDDDAESPDDEPMELSDDKQPAGDDGAAGGTETMTVFTGGDVFEVAAENE